MNLSCSSRVVKYLMFVFNLIFLISGIIILAVGVSAKAYYYQYDTFLDEKYFSLPNLLIATGALIFIISFFGCYGAIKENWIMLMIFSALLVVIFIFEFSAGIAGYVLRDQTSSYLEEKLTASIPKYNDSLEIMKMWDLIQGEFECCGVGGPSDWNKLYPDSSLPISCCPIKSGTVGVFYCNAVPAVTTATSTVSTETSTETSKTNATKETTPTTTSSSTTTNSTTPHAQTETNATTTTVTSAPTTTTPYTTGCETAFGNFIKKHAVQIGGCAFGLAVIQFAGIIFSCHLARQLKTGYLST